MAVLVVVYVVLGVAVLVAVTRSFVLRRHGEAVLPGGDWQRTEEVSVDPTTGRRMRVWVDPRDGSRRYVPDP